MPEDNSGIALIKIDRLRKTYNDCDAVKGISFSLKPGTICGFVGPNGAGKTTTLRCIAGLIRPTGGTVVASGRPLTLNDSDYKRTVVYVPDDPPLFDDLSVGDHLELIGRLYGVANRRIRSVELLQQFSLSHKSAALGHELSRGMRQKLAIACAALADPAVLLLDEPMTGLDPPAIRQLMAAVADWAASGKTILISSHLLAMIGDVCTHVLILDQGEIQFFGSREDLRNQYPAANSLEAAYFAATQKAAPPADRKAAESERDCHSQTKFSSERVHC